MNIPLPPRSELLRLFRLDEETGELFWRVRSDVLPRWNTKHAGKVAGSKNAKGYINVYVNNKIVCAHRVIFKMVYDAEPPLVDHKNRDKADNRPINLRAANWSENGANSTRNRTLPKGVVMVPCGRYHAQITWKRETTYLGAFDDPEEAHRAYRAAAEKLHGEFACFDRG